MDNKDLITRFAEDCFRFEALHQEIDGLIADEVSEVLIYEYEDLANQAAEIVLKLSANGNNLGLNFYRYYVERLEYIIDYFRALLDYEETPLAEDEPNELDDEPAAEVGFEGFPADCAFPPPPPFVFKKWEFKSTPTAKDEENAATDGAGAVEEDDSEDEQSDEVENDAQAAESDEAADAPAAGTPVSEEDMRLPPGVEIITESAHRRWKEFLPIVRAEVRDTFGMWGEMNDFTWRNSGGGDFAKAVKVLDNAEWCFNNVQDGIKQGLPLTLVTSELVLRERINMAIDAIPGFRDSKKFKELIEQYPTYKEKEQ